MDGKAATGAELRRQLEDAERAELEAAWRDLQAFLVERDVEIAPVPYLTTDGRVAASYGLRRRAPTT